MAILGIPNAVGFRSGTDRKIKAGLFNKLRKNKAEWATVSYRNVQNAFSLFSKAPILSGKTKQGTNTSVTVGDKAMVIRFKTANNNASGDGQQRGYAVFPLLGLSTSRKYGARNWLLAGAKQTLKDITKK